MAGFLSVLAVGDGRGADSAAPDEPLPVAVRFRLADGTRVAGELTAWNEQGIDGTFGRRSWTSLHAADAWSLRRRLMDADSAAAWVALGRTMLLMAHEQPAAERFAGRAFHRAQRLDPEIGPAIEQAREAAARAARERVEEAARRAQDLLKTTSPEAEPWRADAWPALAADERTLAVQTMRADARRILELTGLELEPVETDYFLFYSDLPRRDVAKWALELDDMYRRLARIFNLEEKENIFWGKAVIFVFSDRETFRLVEAQGFNHLVPGWATGLCHPLGPKVFVSFHHPGDDLVFAATLVHETAHGFMHRYRTPRRLPTWANEGFADYVSHVSFANSPTDADRRRRGLQFIRAGGNVDAVLDLTYEDGSWPGPDSIGYAVGYLMCELMIRDRPRRFGDWVNAVKAGKDWELALEEDFGVPRRTLVQRFTEWYRVND